MALVVEDGTGTNPAANTYVDASTARAYASARGVTLPVADAEVEAMLVRGMDYIEAQRARFQGTKTQPGVQPLQWPREDVYIDGEEIGVDIMPVELRSAQCQLCIDQQNGFTLQATTDGRIVLREKVDVLEVQYASPAEMAAAGGGVPVFSSAEALLEPLYKSAAGGFGIRTERA